MASGYVACACRDCFEVAIADESDESPAMCHACTGAGCESDGESECSAPHAYCSADSDAGKDDVMIDGVAHCPVCGQPW